MSDPYTEDQHRQDARDSILADNYCYHARQADPAIAEDVLLAGLIEKTGWDQERAARMLETALHPQDY